MGIWKELQTECGRQGAKCGGKLDDEYEGKVENVKLKWKEQKRE